MKKFRWRLVILLGCLMYFTVGGAFSFLVGRNNVSVENPVHNATNRIINVAGYYTGHNVRLRPATTASESVTLLEQARANLVAR